MKRHSNSYKPDPKHHLYEHSFFYWTAR